MYKIIKRFLFQWFYVRIFIFKKSLNKPNDQNIAKNFKK